MPAGVEGRSQIIQIRGEGFKDRHRGEVRFDQPKMIEWLGYLGVGGTFKKPDRGDTGPRPLTLNAIQRQRRIASLLLQGHPSEPRFDTFGRRVTVHLTDPDRFMRVTVCDHHIADPERSREINLILGGSQPPIGRPGEEHIVIDSHDIEAVPGTGIVHPLEKDHVHQVIALVGWVPRAQFGRGGQRPADHSGFEVRGLDPFVSQA